MAKIYTKPNATIKKEDVLPPGKAVKEEVKPLAQLLGAINIIRDLPHIGFNHIEIKGDIIIITGFDVLKFRDHFCFTYKYPTNNWEELLSRFDKKYLADFLFGFNFGGYFILLKYPER